MRHIPSSSSFLFGYRENYIGLGFDVGGKVETLSERERERPKAGLYFWVLMGFNWAGLCAGFS